jgi:hypothetical protein
VNLLSPVFLPVLLQTLYISTNDVIRFLSARLSGDMKEEREKAGSLALLGMTNQKSKTAF